ncbi:MAG: hypothetical protein VYE22_14165 [Myxococcota bacterium]|nr:hypothetical protein [Myxococcota bacterium]
MTQRCILLLALLLSACAETGPAPESRAVTCTGKCDGLDSIRALYDDLRELDLTDLSARGTGLASEGLNDALSGDGVGVEIGEVTAFGLAETAAEEPLVEDLDALGAGLLARFGERELSVTVTETRRRHLRASEDDVFVESRFALDAGLDHGFAIDGDGFDGSAALGLRGSVEGRAIHATRRDAGTSPEAIYAALRETRGFVAPRDLEDVRAMRPGEAFALRGEGAFGVNVGAGVPIVVADPGSLTYSLVVSAALRAQIAGELDVQVVRLEGDEAVIDVGTDRSSVRSARLALEDGWGVSGLARTNVSLGGRDVDLGRLLDRALQRQLNERLSMVSAEVERTGRSTRMSVIRLRFDLSEEDPRLAEALSQAARGDVRLAQALSARGEAGVTLEYDVSRSGLSAVSHAGVELFGMRFFQTTIAEEGSVRVDTPGGAQELLFDSLHREGGWFFQTHGHERVSLAGLRFDADGRAVESEVNLFVQVLEGDEWMERDTTLDHLDALITAVGGPALLAEIEAHGNAIERHVERVCPGGVGPGAACRTDVLDDREVTGPQADALAAIEGAGLEPEMTALLRAAVELRVRYQAVAEPNASLVGPESSVVLGYRMDDASLSRALTSGEGERLRAAVLGVLAAVTVDRADDVDAQRAGLGDDRALDAMVARFEAQADAYERLVAVERARIDGLGAIGGRAVAVDVPLSGDRVDYDAATARSVVQARSQVVRELFDGLVDDADDLDGVRPEAAVAYALLALTRPESMDVRLDLEMRMEDRFGQDYDHYRAAGVMGFDAHARGSQARLIGGGVFDVDALISVE